MGWKAGGYDFYPVLAYHSPSLLLIHQSKGAELAMYLLGIRISHSYTDLTSPTPVR